MGDTKIPEKWVRPYGDTLDDGRLLQAHLRRQSLRAFLAGFVKRHRQRE